MDFHVSDLLVPLELRERRERAQRDLLLQALRGAQTPRSHAAAFVGGLLVRIGTWLQGRPRPAPVPSSWLPVVDPCRGCAN